MPLLYLDIDGVLNDHQPLPNGYCGLVPVCVQNLCKILVELPDVNIVLSSAWRYIMHKRDITPRGFEYLMMIFGAPYDVIHERIVTCTDTDEHTCLDVGLMEADAELDYEWLKENGMDLRVLQIERSSEWLFCGRSDGVYAILDDLPLDSPHLIQTDGAIGLTEADADRVIEYFRVRSA